MLSVAVARSSSDDNAIRYVLPVLWMTLFSHNGLQSATQLVTAIHQVPPLNCVPGRSLLSTIAPLPCLCLKTFFIIFTARRNARIASALLAIAIPSVCLSIYNSHYISHSLWTTCRPERRGLTVVVYSVGRSPTLRRRRYPRGGSAAAGRRGLTRVGPESPIPRKTGRLQFAVTPPP